MEGDDTVDTGTLTLALCIGAIVVVATTVLVYQRWTTYWHTADKINFLVAAGTLALAVSTVVLARYTLRSVRAAQQVISAEDLRHKQALAPILKASVIIDETKREVTNLRITNNGLGPALQVGMKAEVQYERRQVKNDGSFEVVEKKSFSMMNVMADVVGAKDSAIVPNGAYPGWVLSADGFGCGQVTIVYSDVFGNIYESVGGHLFGEYYYWMPPTSLFSKQYRDTKVREYVEQQNSAKTT